MYYDITQSTNLVKVVLMVHTHHQIVIVNLYSENLLTLASESPITVVQHIKKNRYLPKAVTTNVFLRI